MDFDSINERESDGILDVVLEPDEDLVSREAVDFQHGNPMDVFCAVVVYAEFDSPNLGRHVVAHAVPGYPGRWVLVYSSLRRLRRACGNDEVEYSCVKGVCLLDKLPEGAGVWFDRSFPGGRPILMPAPSLPVGTG